MAEVFEIFLGVEGGPSKALVYLSKCVQTDALL